MNTELIAALVGALAGGLVSFFVNHWLEAHRRDSIWSGLEVCVAPVHDDKIALRVINHSAYSIHRCFAYISIEHSTNDLAEPPYGYDQAEMASRRIPTHFTREIPGLVHEDRLHWSITGNPAGIDICSGESQSLELMRTAHRVVWDGYETGSLFGVFSETPGVYRAFLNSDKKYFLTLRIVSDDMRAKVFALQIDARNKEPVRMQFRYSIFP